jgi:hypothetical protein
MVKLKPTLDGGPKSKFFKTNLGSLEANWILKLDLALDPNLHINILNHVFRTFFWF